MLLASTAVAQDNPLSDCRALRMIVPYTAGGGGDVGARLLAPALSAQLNGLPVQVENVPGAGSQIGISQLATARPDGCTVGWTHLPAAITIYLDKKRRAAFNRTSLAPVAMFVVDGGAIAVAGNSPFSDLSSLVAAAKASPGKISISDSGVLSEGHILLRKFGDLSGADFNIVHGTGGAEGVADLLGGHVDAMTINLSGANAEMARSGQIRVLGIFTDAENAKFPGVATAQAQGFDMTSATSRAISAPGKTDPKIIAYLSSAVKAAMADPDFVQKAADIGLALRYMDQDQTAEYWGAMEAEVAPIVASEIAK